MTPANFCQISKHKTINHLNVLPTIISRYLIFRPKLDILVALVLQDKPVEDDLLAMELEEENQVPPKDADNFFRMCLTGRFPKSAKFLISQDQKNNAVVKTLSAVSESSII